MSVSLQVQERTARSRGQLRQLRNGGTIPGIIYGKSIANPINIAVSEKELLHLLRTHPNAVLELQVGSEKQPVMITQVQRDPLSRSVLHIDFHRINMNEEVKAAVRIELVGESQGVREGGILQAMLHEMEVHCLPNRIPESIEVDVSQLQVGENLLVSDLKLPAGVESRLDDDQVVVTVLAPQKEVSEEEAEIAEKLEAVETVRAE